MIIYMLSDYLKSTYGKKLNKISIDAGMTCPNRDGKCGIEGCIFCKNGGAGKSAGNRNTDAFCQIESQKQKLGLDKDDEIIAYFQSYSNTYDTLENLRNLYLPIVLRNDVKILSIATRPDCITSEITELLSELNRIKPVWVELGLQTIHENTAKFIRRGYPLSQYDIAVEMLKNAGITVITHLIFGLPGESKTDMIESARYVGNVTDGIKFHSLYIEEGSDLEKLYSKGGISVLSRDEYIDILCEAVRNIPKNVVIHRLTGDCDKDTLIAPQWSKNKIKVLRAISESFYDRNIIQGELI